MNKNKTVLGFLRGFGGNTLAMFPPNFSIFFLNFFGWFKLKYLEIKNLNIKVYENRRESGRDVSS